jgi:HAD superfamily hydrolase (TIGR01490 family)
MRKTIAVFDIDGTILPASSAERIFIRYLISKGELSIADAARYAMRFMARLPCGWVRATKGNKIYLRGKSESRIAALAKSCFNEEISPRISERARERIEEHMSRGEEIVLLSGTLDVLLESFTAQLGADHSHGSMLIVEDEIYTGEIEGLYPYGSAKAAIVKKYYGQFLYDLSESFAYANHYTDLEFLELFGHPTIVNPDSRLTVEARKRGIGIVNF